MGEHSMYWRDTVAFTGHGSQQFLGVFEAHAAAGQTFERIASRLEQIEGGAIGGDVYAEGADEAQLLDYEQVGRKSRSASAESAGAGDNDGPGGTGQRDRLRESRWCPGGYVHDHIRHRAGRLAQRGDRIVDGNVNGKVGAERRRQQRQPIRVTRAQPRHHHERGAGFFCRRGRAQPPNSRAEHSHDIAGFGAGNRYSPTYSSAQWVEQRRHH
jgi:hypothetical protein